MRAEEQSQIIKAIMKLVTEKQMGGGQFRKLAPAEANRSGAFYSYRASRKIRLLINRPGKRWELVNIVHKGSRELLTSER